MKISTLQTQGGILRQMAAARIIAVVLTLLLALPAAAATVTQKRFPSPEEAVASLTAAIKGGDEQQLLAILGPGSRELISSGDPVADRAGRDKFLAAYGEKNELEHAANGTVVLHVGSDGWPLPIPLVKKGESWAFDTAKGKRELLKRRIGRNELHVMEVLDAYVDAQQEYASRDCRGEGRVEFAQRLISSDGKRDGLYWEAKEGEQQSPLGPLMARAAREGYPVGDLAPFHGYYFRILKGQGKHAPGGAYSYVVKGKMILGFALVAYPAEYGSSGVMTFMVGQDGTVYEKNLGKGTRRLAEAMKRFDPDTSWKPVTADKGRPGT